jgi:hypothetical protein
MRLTSKSLVTAAIVQLATFGAFAQYTYQLDTGTAGSFVYNASEGTEPLDNWIGNQFTALAGFSRITGVDFACGTVSNGSTFLHTAEVAIYRIGNPHIGSTTLLYTQNFAPAQNAWNHITLSTSVSLHGGDMFMVSILFPNVIAAPPNDIYPWVLDNGGTHGSSYWDRSAPNTFNLNDLSGAVQVDSPLTAGGFVPGDATHGHLMLRAIGVPEPSSFALAGLGAAALLIFRRRKV